MDGNESNISCVVYCPTCCSEDVETQSSTIDHGIFSCHCRSCNSPSWTFCMDCKVNIISVKTNGIKQHLKTKKHIAKEASRIKLTCITKEADTSSIDSDYPITDYSTNNYQTNDDSSLSNDDSTYFIQVDKPTSMKETLQSLPSFVPYKNMYETPLDSKHYGNNVSGEFYSHQSTISAIKFLLKKAFNITESPSCEETLYHLSVTRFCNQFSENQVREFAEIMRMTVDGVKSSTQSYFCK